MLTNVAHELGHNHGRNHPWKDEAWAPSQAGETGCRSSWGLGIRPGPYPTEYWYPALTDPSAIVMPPVPDLTSCEYDKENPTPTTTGDVMSYTFPHWVDPYTYNAFAERIRTVSAFPNSTAKDTWKEQRTLFASYQKGGEVRWTWGYGALGQNDSLDGRTAEFISPSGKKKQLPVRSRIGSNGEVYGFSVPLPPDARAHTAQGTPIWAGRLSTHINGYAAKINLETLKMAP